MPFLFISHASEDKRDRVRPLVEALVLQGIQVWVDRPGHGDSHLGFDLQYIQRHQILGLRAGEDWGRQISQALADAGAVLVCLSRALCASRSDSPTHPRREGGRQVLAQELLLASHHEKLVACIVDDLSWSELPSDWGLADLSRIQATRLNPPVLQQAVDQVNAGTDAAVLVGPARDQWEIVRSLVHDVTRIFNRSGLVLAPPEVAAAVTTELLAVPIGPMVKAGDIPLAVVALFADRYADPGQARQFIAYAMELRGQSNPESFTNEQILLRPGELLNPYTVPADDFWSDVLASAGRKSRRTLAALLRAPGGPQSDTTSPEAWDAVTRFNRWLEEPSLNASR